MTSSLHDTTALVTGASSGIGAATAIALAERGARVVLAARREERLRDVVRQIESGGGQALAVQCDVADRAQVNAAVAAARARFGPADILVNNAGVMALASMTRCRVDDWQVMIDVNLRGVLHFIGACLPALLERGRGHIVNVSSVAGRKLFNGAAVYCGTKAAVHMISEGLRSDLAEQARDDGNRIRVTIIAPGVVATELPESVRDEDSRRATEKYYQEFEDPLTSEDIASAIVWALEAPDHMNVNEIVVRPVRQVK